MTINLFFSDSTDDQVGPLIVPANYVPSTNVVCPENLEKLMEDNPGNKHLPKGLLSASKGEMVEKEVYDLLRDFYGKEKNPTLIISNNILVHPEATKKEINQSGEGKQEADFLIVDKEIQTLINIEVKSFLGKNPDQPDEDSPTTKVTKQMAKVREILGDAFQSDLKGPWKVVSIVYCLKAEAQFKKCPSCNNFIAEGKDELLEKLQQLRTKRKKQVAGTLKYTNDFLTTCKFFLFCCPVMSLPVLGNLPKSVQDAVLKSGSRENIALYCFPTPQQRGILWYPWLIFAAPFGSGKTLFMIFKAIELANDGEEVLFLIFVQDEYEKTCKKTLLCLDLEEKFKEHPNIKVQMVPFQDDRADNLKGEYFIIIRHIFR